MHKITRRKFVALTATGVAAHRGLDGAFDRRRSHCAGSGRSHQEEHWRRLEAGHGRHVQGRRSVDCRDPHRDHVARVAGCARSCGEDGREPDHHLRADFLLKEPTRQRLRSDAASGRAHRHRVPPTPLPPPPPDPVFSAKDAFLKKHNLVMFRFSDHWRLRKPDPFAQGLADALGWSKFAARRSKAISIPETSLEALVAHVKKALKSRGGMRIVGDPQLRVRKVALLPGSTPIQASIETLPGVDAIIAGEVREWESVEYVRDTDELGGKKALILTGRIVSEDPGMQVCAQWLKTIVPEVASTWVSAGDPYWRPNA